MNSLLLFPLARAPDRPLISESGFNSAVPHTTVRADERQAPVPRFIVLQSLPIEFHVASVSTLGALVRLHIARREATCKARRTNSATAERSRVVQHFLVEISGGPVLIACVTPPSLGVAGAVDALPGIRFKSPCVFVNSASFACMTSGAAKDRVPSVVCRVVPLTAGEHEALQTLSAHGARLGLAGAVDALPGIRSKSPCVFPSSASFACVTSSAAQEPILSVVCRVVPLTVGEHQALQTCSAHGAGLWVAGAVDALPGIRFKSPGVFASAASVACVTSGTPKDPVASLATLTGLASFATPVGFPLQLMSRCPEL